MSNTVFFNYFSKKAEVLQKYFELSAGQKSSTVLGSNREIFINEFTNKTLPQKLHVTTGEIIDHKDKTTGQLDTIIIRNDTPTLDFGGKDTYLAGGVFAVIEIKSFLNSTKLTEAHNTLEKVAKLSIPITTIQIGFEWPTEINIFKIIFAYSGNSLKTTQQNILIKDYLHEIDIVCILDKGILVKKNIMKSLSNDFTKYESFDNDFYIALNSPAAALAFLYSIITQFGNTFLGGRETIEPYLLNPRDTWDSNH